MYMLQQHVKCYANKELELELELYKLRNTYKKSTADQFGKLILENNYYWYQIKSFKFIIIVFFNQFISL